MKPDRWEMGSEFHWADDFVSRSGKREQLYGGIFASGRAALMALAESQRWRGRTILLPTYFCPDVTAALAQVFNIRWYIDHPIASAPEFGSINVDDGDIVLAVNYFGVRTGSTWTRWIAEHAGCFVIDDLSHDPNPALMLESPAHYVLASLRKTIPIADGALVMSPRGMDVPKTSEPVGGSLKLEGMVLKSMYLQGLPVEKDAFRQLLISGESRLDSQVSASVSTFAVLNSLDVRGLRMRRTENVRYLLESKAIRGAGVFEPLFASWPDDATPFSLVLRCQSHSIREELRRHLIQHRVYPAVHWVQEGPHTSGDQLSKALGDQLLTIPSDFRYDFADLDRLLSVLEAFQA